MIEAPGKVEALLGSARNLALAIQGIEPKIAGEVARMLDARDGPDRVADRLASVFFPDSIRRQELLEERVVEVRLRAVVERMTTYLAQLSATKAGDGAMSN